MTPRSGPVSPSPFFRVVKGALDRQRLIIVLTAQQRTAVCAQQLEDPVAALTHEEPALLSCQVSCPRAVPSRLGDPSTVTPGSIRAAESARTGSLEWSGDELERFLDAYPFAAEADEFWRSDWSYLATADVQHVDAIASDVTGLALPRRVVRKIYYANARRVFGLSAH